jgi:hypothetical protein
MRRRITPPGHRSPSSFQANLPERITHGSAWLAAVRDAEK